MSDDVDGAIEIRDPGIDAEAIMRQIREDIRKRRAQAEAQGMDYEALVEGLYASPAAARFDRSLYHDLHYLSASYNRIGVGLSLTASRLPLVAPLVQRVRGALHHLVIYYTNMLAAQQARFNEYVVRVLTGLVKALEQEPSQEEVGNLHRELNELQARLERIETHWTNR